MIEGFRGTCFRWRPVHIMLEGRACVHRNDSWMAVHRKCIHTFSEFALPVNALPGQPTPMYQKVNFKLLLFHWRQDASITKTSSDAFLEWFTRCGEAPHGSVREFLGVCYFRPLESKSSLKTAVPSADVNGPWGYGQIPDDLREWTGVRENSPTPAIFNSFSSSPLSSTEVLYAFVPSSNHAIQHFLLSTLTLQGSTLDLPLR